MTHNLDCRCFKVIWSLDHHNKVRDALGDLDALGYRKVVRESVLNDGMMSSQL